MLDTVTFLLLIIAGLYAWPLVGALYWFLEETDRKGLFVACVIFWPVTLPILLVYDVIWKARNSDA